VTFAIAPSPTAPTAARTRRSHIPKSWPHRRRRVVEGPITEIYPSWKPSRHCEFTQLGSFITKTKPYCLFLCSTKNKDNLSPVATKQSGCFAFGKKPKPSSIKDNVSLTPASNPAPPQDAQPEPASQTGEENITQPDPPASTIPTIDNIYNHIMIDYR